MRRPFTQTHQGICEPESRPGDPSQVGLLATGRIPMGWRPLSWGSWWGQEEAEQLVSNWPPGPDIPVSPVSNKKQTPWDGLGVWAWPACLCQCLSLVVGVLSYSPLKATTRGARPGARRSEPQHDTLSPARAPPPGPAPCPLTCPAASLQGRNHRAPDLEGEERRWVGDPIQARSHCPSKRQRVKET